MAAVGTAIVTKIVTDGAIALLKDLATLGNLKTFISSIGPTDPVTSGTGPRATRVTINNTTKYKFKFGNYYINYGKVVEGQSATDINPNSIMNMKVSGRVAAFYGAAGAMDYTVYDGNDQIGQTLFEWSYPYSESNGQAGRAEMACNQIDAKVEAKDGALTITVIDRAISVSPDVIVGEPSSE
jgi:hypothetical protein